MACLISVYLLMASGVFLKDRNTLLEPREVSLSALLAEVEALIAPMAAKNGHVWRLDQALEGDKAHIDPLKLRQCLINLASNACKFIENGVERLTARLRKSPGGGVLVFEVADTGVGICPTQADVLFKPFVQADGSTSRRFEGTSLGLSITRALAAA